MFRVADPARYLPDQYGSFFLQRLDGSVLVGLFTASTLTFLRSQRLAAFRSHAVQEDMQLECCVAGPFFS